ncbi:hypothetical protein BpHYR1_025462 [Brachionus plicatilis]|uniref:Uncharacterized protein n=1 Tax=Brachionus plicatilis TaxID=10195 RepID=A0A3M7RSJ8_BRAPC|nr:hypothetical protein BpHYR1_025462 [Brachionus plicatilis]
MFMSEIEATKIKTTKKITLLILTHLSVLRIALGLSSRTRVSAGGRHNAPSLDHGVLVARISLPVLSGLWIAGVGGPGIIGRPILGLRLCGGGRAAVAPRVARAELILQLDAERVSDELFADVVEAATVNRGIGVARSRPHFTVVKFVAVLGLAVGHAARLHLAGRPVGADFARAQPLAVHLGDGRLGVHFVHKRDKAVAFVHQRLRVFHYFDVGYFAEGREGVAQRLLVDFGRQVAHEYVVVF